MLSRADLHAYQEHTVEFALNTPRAMLCLGLGLGKTASTLTAISDLIDAFEVRRVLVVAPLRVALTTWPGEIAKWSHLKHLTYSVLCGSHAERLRALKKDADIHITNVDNLAWLEPLAKKHPPYDMIVFDESSMFKNASTQRFKVARRMCRDLKRTLLLTATPAPNGYTDLWAQLYLIDGGKRLGPAFHPFRSTYFHQVDRDGYKWAIRRGAAERIQAKISDVMLTLRAEDYLSVPDRVDIDVPVRLDEATMAAYTEFEQKLVQTLPEGRIEATSAAALAVKLMQYANGQVYDADRVVLPVHDAKLDALRELVDGSDEPLLVSYTFQSDRDRMLAAFPQAVAMDKNPATIDRWNGGEIPMLLAHPASAGHGLNLQYGGRRLIWYGPTWSLELYLQMNGRLHRQGQDKPVLVHHLIAQGTIDELIMGVLSGKNATQEGLLIALRHRVENKVEKTLDTV